MKATDARTVLARTISTIDRYMPAGHARSRLLGWLQDLSSALASPASLCSREELFDAVICDTPPEGEPSLLDDLLEQHTTGALVAYLNDRLAAEERARRLRTIDPTPDPTEAP